MTPETIKNAVYRCKKAHLKPNPKRHDVKLCLWYVYQQEPEEEFVEQVYQALKSEEQKSNEIA